MNPRLQVHVNDPLVFIQSAFSSQGLESAEHSSISKEKTVFVYFTKQATTVHIIVPMYTERRMEGRKEGKGGGGGGEERGKEVR